MIVRDMFGAMASQDRSLIPSMSSLVVGTPPSELRASKKGSAILMCRLCLCQGLRVYPGNTSMPITNTLNLWSVQATGPICSNRQQPFS